MLHCKLNCLRLFFLPLPSILLPFTLLPCKDDLIFFLSLSYTSVLTQAGFQLMKNPLPQAAECLDYGENHVPYLQCCLFN